MKIDYINKIVVIPYYQKIVDRFLENLVTTLKQLGLKETSCRIEVYPFTTLSWSVVIFSPELVFFEDYEVNVYVNPSDQDIYGMDYYDYILYLENEHGLTYYEKRTTLIQPLLEEKQKKFDTTIETVFFEQGFINPSRYHFYKRLIANRTERIKDFL